MMKFVALFALCCLATAANVPTAPRDETVAAVRDRLPYLDLDLPEDRKPVVHTRAPFEDLDLDATLAPKVTPTAKPENGHHGIGVEHGSTEAHSEATPTSTGLPVVVVTSTAAPTESTDATTDIPVTKDDHTDVTASEKPATDANTDSTNTDKVSTEAAATTDDATNTGNPTTDDSTESTNTDSANTDSSNTEPTTDSTGEVDGNQGKKPDGLSTASISAIVIGGVLAVAVVVAVAMAIVRRRRMAPERRGILDA